ncbi:MAG: DNA alkylation repair protein [Actinobacteria bacterium HGW-Actinobacteria-7]|jgi:3-methyladenine DNA glycosylase AlkD|nr:MAG: DNA alkylation repair protein [Actinobacteria bacterium HGW-Actinobacteria-7]
MEHKPTPSGLADSLLSELRAHANPDNVAGMARFGITTTGTLGVGMSDVRTLARDAKHALRADPAARHELAALLWRSGVHEARIMATLVDVATLVDEAQMESWVADLDSWDVCDTLCNNLFRLAAPAWEKAAQWAGREPEYIKRAGFVLGATLAVHDKAASDERFASVLSRVEREATDERNAVKKGANWALRQVGKRSASLNALAIASAERILAENPASPSARWIARDALRELRGEPVRKRLGLT